MEFRGFDALEQFNLADHLLDARVREGFGSKTALITSDRTFSYSDVQRLANRFGNLLRELGVEQENRVIISLPDIPEYVGALFGILKIGAVVVMVNPQLKAEDIAYFLDYTRAKVAIVSAESYEAFAEAAKSARFLKKLVNIASESLPANNELQTAPTHRDDPAIWLFSGGTTGKPKAVVQTHLSFANTTECYGKRHLN